MRIFVAIQHNRILNPEFNVSVFCWTQLWLLLWIPPQCSSQDTHTYTVVGDTTCWPFFYVFTLSKLCICRWMNLLRTQNVSPPDDNFVSINCNFSLSFARLHGVHNINVHFHFSRTYIEKLCFFSWLMLLYHCSFILSLALYLSFFSVFFSILYIHSIWRRLAS